MSGPRTEAGRTMLAALAGHASWFLGGGPLAETAFVTAIEAEAAALDVELLAEAMKSIDHEMAQMPGGESLADPADDPIRREYAAEVARRYALLRRRDA